MPCSPISDATSSGTRRSHSTTIRWPTCQASRWRSGETAMNIRGVFIEETFAEAFTMRVARIIITARSERWVREAALKLTGFATSVIGCKVEAGIERRLPEAETPDGRPGLSVLMMTMGKDDLPKRLIER